MKKQNTVKDLLDLEISEEWAIRKGGEKTIWGDSDEACVEEIIFSGFQLFICLLSFHDA